MFDFEIFPARGFLLPIPTLKKFSIFTDDKLIGLWDIKSIENKHEDKTMASKRNFIPDIYLSHPNYPWQHLRIYTVPVLSHIAQERFGLTVPKRAKKDDIIAMIEEAQDTQATVIEEAQDTQATSSINTEDKTMEAYILLTGPLEGSIVDPSGRWLSYHEVEDEYTEEEINSWQDRPATQHELSLCPPQYLEAIGLKWRH